MFEICPQIFPLIVPPVPNPWCFRKSPRRTTSRKNWTGYLQPFPSYEAFSMRESLGMAKYDPRKGHLSVEFRAPSQYMVFKAHPSSHWKRDIDRFGRFCKADGCVRVWHTDTHTDHEASPAIATSYAMHSDTAKQVVRIIWHNYACMAERGGSWPILLQQ